MDIQRMFEERQHAVAELRAMTEAAEGRDFDATDAVKAERLEAAIADLGARIERGLADLETAKSVDEQRARYEALLPTTPAATPEVAATDAALLRKMVSGEIRGHEFRSLLSGSGSGASAVPTSFYNAVVDTIVENAGVLAMGPTVLNTTSGESLQVPVQTAYSAASAVLTEGSAITASDPTLSRKTLGAYKFGHLVQVSSELLADEAIDIQSFLSRQAGVALANGAGSFLAVGTGSSQPEGIATAATSVAAAASATLASDDLFTLYHSVATGYRARGAWLMKDATLKSIRTMKDSSNQYLWQPGLALGTPDTLLGRPVFTDPNMASVATGNRSVVFGDPSAFFVRIAGGVQVARSDEYAFNADLSTFRFTIRLDSKVVDANGIFALKHP